MKGIIGLTGQAKTYRIGVGIVFLAPILFAVGFMVVGEFRANAYFHAAGLSCSLVGLFWNFTKIKCPICKDRWMKQMYRLNRRRQTKISLFSITCCPNCNTNFGNKTS